MHTTQTTQLQLASAFYDGTQALLSDCGPAGAAGAWAPAQRRCIHRGRRTNYGTTGLTEQREAAAELSVAQDLSKDFGPTGSSGRRRRRRRGRSTFQGLRAGRIRRMGMQECTAASGRLDRATFQERASNALDFGPKLLHADQRTGLGPGSQ